MPNDIKTIVFNADEKFDIQLSQALIDEKRLADVFRDTKLEFIELKTESRHWRLSRTLCIEVRRDGKPSGLSTTKADWWVHELRDDGRTETFAYIMFPVARLKELVKRVLKENPRRLNKACGDGKRSSCVFVPMYHVFDLNMV